MTGANFPIGIIATAQDRASATLGRIEQSTKRLDKAFVSLRGRIRTAFEFHVINRAIQGFERAIYRAAHAIPDLIARGEKWATVVDEIADVTGLSARKASELAAVQSYLMDGTDSLGRALMVMSKNAVNNREAFDQLGIATRDSNGRLLDAYEIIGNVRQRISETGQGLLSTAAAQKVFGRGAHDLLDLLSLTNRQWAIYAESAHRSGLILTQAGLEAADQWTRTKRLLDGAITGIGAQILQGAAPALIGLTNAVTGAIQTNMGNIVRFVSGAITFIASLVSGLFGLDMDAVSVVEQVARAGGSRGGGLSQRNFAGPGDASRKAAAGTREHANATLGLAKALREARAELARARASNTGFGGEMSLYDRERAAQERQARIRDAQERVKEAQDALTKHRSTMGRMADITAIEAKRMRGSLAGIFPGGVSGKGPIIDGLQETVNDAKAFGSQIADSIKDAILGEDKVMLLPNGMAIEVRSGGLLSQIQNLAKVIGDSFKWVADNTEALKLLAIALVGGKIAAGVGGFLGGVRGGIGALPLSVPGLAAIAGGAMVGGPLAAWLWAQQNPGNIPRGVGSSDRPLGPMDQRGRFFNPNYQWGNANWFWSMTGGKPSAVPPAPGGPGSSFGELPPAPGMGVNPYAYQFNAIGTALRNAQAGYLGESGTVPRKLDDILAALFAVNLGIAGINAGGGGGGGVAALAARVATVEAVNQAQTGRLDQIQDVGIPGLKASIAAGLAARVTLKAHNAFKAATAVNLANRLPIKTFAEFKVNQRATDNGQSTRIKTLERAVFGGSGTASRMKVTIQLSAQATRSMLAGAPVTTTTRPATGT